MAKDFVDISDRYKYLEKGLVMFYFKRKLSLTHQKIWSAPKSL